MADHNYTSVNPEENVCEVDPEVVCVTNPPEQELAGEKPVDDEKNDLKSEIIKEATQFIEYPKTYVEYYKVGNWTCYISIGTLCKNSVEARLKLTEQTIIVPDKIIKFSDCHRRRFKFIKTENLPDLIFGGPEERCFEIIVDSGIKSSSITLMNGKGIIDKTISKRTSFLIEENMPDGDYIISIWSSSNDKLQGTIGVQQSIVRELMMEKSETVKDPYDKDSIIIRFKFTKDFLGVADLNIDASGYIIKWQVVDDQEKTVSTKNDHDYLTQATKIIIEPETKGNLVLKVEAQKKQEIGLLDKKEVSARIYIHKDTMSNENGAMWSNLRSADNYDTDLYFTEYFDRRKIIYKSKWYIPAKWVNVLKNILFNKIFEKSDTEIESMYSDIKAFVSILLSTLGFIAKSASIVTFVAGTMMTLADVGMSPKEKYSALMEQLISENVGCGRSIDELNYEFKYGVVLEQYFYKFREGYSICPPIVPSPKQYEPIKYFTEIVRWDSYPNMEGQEGVQGMFNVNELGKMSKNFE